MNSNLAFLFLEELGNTLIMTFASSALAYVIGIPLGILLVVWAKNGILVIAIQNFTRKLVGTSVGTKAIIVPLTLASAPYVARIVEASLNEVDPGVIEAAKSMGASTWQIIVKVLLPEAKPSLITNGAIAVTTILGYSAMAGFCGAGGLGAVAINYGYYRFEDGIMWIAILFLVILVQVIQSLGMTLVKKVDRRAR